VIEQTLRDADRSYTVEELARLAYPEITQVEKKHRVAILRTFSNVEKRAPLWFFSTYTPPWRLIVTNRNNVRSFAHGLLRHSWWNAERTLDDIEKILSDPEIQSVIEPGGFWWAEVEINKAKADIKSQMADSEDRFQLELYWRLKKQTCYYTEKSPELENIWRELITLQAYWDFLAKEDRHLHILLGKFEPPGTPVFEYAMECRAKENCRLTDDPQAAAVSA
jgi:hypothetical protein